MIKYNTQLPQLKLREYGRNIQELVEHCLTIEDREERTKYAYSIANIMIRLFPEHNGEDINSREVWDNINVISGFNLDIDYPCEVLSETELRPSPSRIPYAKKSDRFRCYGDNIVGMIREISKMEGGVEKDKMIFLVANQMKKLLLNINADSATDSRVLKDIGEISGGRIEIDPVSYRLNDYIGVNEGSDNKKKKKK
ncbi:MAG: DUF4290 domain-containing protein [Muribaculaceae bacterium]|nr:DUF4290 domain-containing protein [Muribaculaceae bacterium]